MIQDCRSVYLFWDSGVIDSPVLGKIPPTGLSGGVKTLILVKLIRIKYLMHQLAETIVQNGY